MADETPGEKAKRLLPDCPNRERGSVREVERAVRSGWEIDPELARAIQDRIKQKIMGVDADGKPTGKTPGPRTLRSLGALAVQMDRLAMDRGRTGKRNADLQIPITPEQLQAMSDEELEDLDRRLDKLAGE